MSCKPKAVNLILVTLLFLSWRSYGQIRTIYSDADPANEVMNLSFYSPNEGYVAFKNWIGYSQDSGRTFTKIYPQQSALFYNNAAIPADGLAYYGVHARDKNHLILYGLYFGTPAIYYSGDGGQTFAMVFYNLVLGQSVTFIRDVVINDSGLGFAIDDDRILRTTNFGQSWQQIRIDIGSGFNTLQLFANGTAIVSGSKKICISTNQGTSWKIASVPSDTYTSSFIDENKGWSINGTGKVYYTDNGGIAWRQMNTEDYYIKTGFVSALKFINDSTGYAMSPQQILKTTDSGRIWEPLEGPVAFENKRYGELHFFNNNQFWCGEDHGHLELTTNGGGTTLPVAVFKSQINSTFDIAVDLINLSKKGYTYNWYRNNQLISTSYNTTYLSSATLDTIMLVVIKAGYRDTAIGFVDMRIKPDRCSAQFNYTNDTSVLKLTAAYNSAGVKHYWNFGDGQSDNVNVSPVHTYAKSGYYTVTHKVFNPVDGCTDSTAQTIRIVRTTNCVHGTINFTVDSFNVSKINFSFSPDTVAEQGVESYYGVSWDFGDGQTIANRRTIEHVFDTAGTYFVTARITHQFTSCVNIERISIVITLPSACDADFIVNDSKETLEFTGKPLSGKRHMWIFYNRDTVYTADEYKLNKAFYQMVWALGDDFNTASNYCNDSWVKEYQLNELKGTVTHVVYDSLGGCRSSATKTFTIPTAKKVWINVHPDPLFPSYVTFSAFEKVDMVLSTGQKIDSLPYSSRWRIGSLYDGAYTGSRNYSTVSEFFPDARVNVISIASSECRGGIREVYSMYYAVPERDPCDGYPADFTYAPDSTNSNKIIFTSSSSANYVNGLLLGWKQKWISGNDTSTAPNPVFTYPGPGVYPVTLQYYNAAGCVEEVTKTVSTYPADFCQITPSFETSIDSTIQGKVSFRNTTTPALADVKYHWNFGDASPSDSTMHPVHKYASSGTFNVCLEIMRGEQCIRSSCMEVKIEPEGHNLHLYPNPADDEVRMAFESDVAGNYKVDVVNAQGGIARSITFRATQGSNIASIKVSGLRNGLYFVRISNGNNQVLGRFMKIGL